MLSPYNVFFHLLFLAFATLVVHACQRLVEHATWQIEPVERQASLPRAAFCLGCLVWALDVVGFLMYPWARLEEARLVPAMFALVLMLVLARVVMPLLARTSDLPRALVASLGLALGVVALHLVVASALGRRPVSFHRGQLALAVALGFLIAAGMAVAHRSHRLPGGSQGELRGMAWHWKVLAGAGILVLHRALDRAMPLEPHNCADFGGLLPALLILALFAVIVCLDQVLGLGAERQRREVFDRALALLRSASVSLTGKHGRLLCMVAERAREVLDLHTFTMHFQPIVTLAENRQAIRFEALMRARHPDLGAINPELFFLACERRGLNALADRAVIRESLRLAGPWTALGHRVLGVAVNVSPGTLLEPDFLPWLEHLLKVSETPRGWLELEITEHALVAASGPLPEVLARLKDLGVGTFLDDFGAGFSALGLLPRLPIRGIKCDRSLLQGAGNEPTRLVILETICRMAGALGIEATVEGIETRADLDRVRACGATAGQGYFLARPMPAPAVAAWLDRESGRTCPSGPDSGLVAAPAHQA